jgi:hypothetical protein
VITGSFSYALLPGTGNITIPDSETSSNLQVNNTPSAPQILLPHSTVVGAGVVLAIHAQDWDINANVIYIGPQAGDQILYPSLGGVQDSQSIPPTTNGTITPGQFKELDFGGEVISDGHGHWYLLGNF